MNEMLIKNDERNSNTTFALHADCVHEGATKLIIIFQIHASGTKTEGEKLAKDVVKKDATKSNEEEFVGSMETQLHQHIETGKIIKEATLQAWDEVEIICVWLYNFF